MGLRGPGAKPIKTFDKSQNKKRKILPWEVVGLTRVEKVIAFLEDLPITQGKLAGSNLRIRDWQRKFLEAVYFEDSPGNRPVRTAVLSIPRKNGKTQLIAGLALCHLLGPESEIRGECYACANDRFQAGKTFNEMVAIINSHSELSERCNIIRFKKEIEVLSGDGEGSIFAALSADAATKHGTSPSFVCYDEAGLAPKRDLFEAMDSGMGARENPLMCVISTQAADDFHLMSELVDYGHKINSGEIVDPSFHLTFFGADIHDDIWSIETWKKANPALGDFRSLQDVERQAAQAQRIPSKENSFRNYILNMRVAAHSRFISKVEWDKCGGKVILNRLIGKKCFGGLDLSASRDLTAFVLVFPNDSGEFDIVPQFFLPENGIAEKSDNDRVPYEVWGRDNVLTLIPGATVDPSFVAEAMAEASELYDIQVIGYDRWRIEDLKRELSSIGSALPLEPFGQGFKDMAGAVDKLERVVAQEKLNHGSNPILNMCAANAVIERDAAGNRKLTKAKSAGRIDGLVALAMALTVIDRFKPKRESKVSQGKIFEASP